MTFTVTFAALRSVPHFHVASFSIL